MIARLTHLPNRLRFMLSAALLGLLPIQPSSARDLPLHEVTLPPGFSISLYAEKIPGARSMVLGAKGTARVCQRVGKPEGASPRLRGQPQNWPRTFDV